MTLDDHERPLRTVFQNTWFFGACHENLNEDKTHTMNGKSVAHGLYSFWQYEDYAEIFLAIARLSRYYGGV